MRLWLQKKLAARSVATVYHIIYMSADDHVISCCCYVCHHYSKMIKMIS